MNFCSNGIEMKNGDSSFKSNLLVDCEIKKGVVILIFLRRKFVHCKEVTINKDSKNNKDINSTNEIVSAIQDEANVINDIIKD